MTQTQNPPPIVTQPQNPLLYVLAQQPLPPINPLCIQLHHLTTTQEDVINYLTQNSANITQMVNRLLSSTLSHHSTLANTLEQMAQNANEVFREVTKWDTWRDRCHAFYADGLSYQQVKDKDIKKGTICSLFTYPISGDSLSHTTKTFPIHWCIHTRMRSCFSDRWYMVFDLPSCNNYEVPLYFLRKLYCEFILGEKPNYFDICEFQDRGRGSV